MCDDFDNDTYRNLKDELLFYGITIQRCKFYDEKKQCKKCAIEARDEYERTICRVCKNHFCRDHGNKNVSLCVGCKDFTTFSGNPF